MSQIAELGTKLENVPNILARYEAALDGVEEQLKIEGKTLEVANRETPVWLAYYDERRVELHTLVKYFEMKVKRVRGKLYKSYTDGPKSNREHSDRVKDKYIDNEEAYLTMNEVFLEVEEIYNKYAAVVNAFEKRGYTLNNITKAIVAAVESDIIT